MSLEQIPLAITAIAAGVLAGLTIALILETRTLIDETRRVAQVLERMEKTLMELGRSDSASVGAVRSENDAAVGRRAAHVRRLARSAIRVFGRTRDRT